MEKKKMHIALTCAYSAKAINDKTGPILWCKILICDLYTFRIDGFGRSCHSCTLSVKVILCDYVVIFVTNWCIEVSEEIWFWSL